MRDYPCRVCKRTMLSSDSPLGRVRVTCPYRDCRVSQLVHLGGQRAAPELIRDLERWLVQLRHAAVAGRECPSHAAGRAGDG